MLSFRDAFTLAWAKFLDRKLWNSLFLMLEIILFTIVLTFNACATGFEQSLQSFNNEGINGKFLVTASNIRANPNLIDDPATWDLAESLYLQHTNEHAALAEQIGLNYSKDSEPAPTEYIDGQRIFNAYTKYAQMAIDLRMQDYLKADLTDLEKILEKYDPQKIYQINTIGANGTLALLRNNTENLADYQSNDPLIYGVHITDDELYDYYLFDNDAPTDSKAIPITLSLEQAEQYLQLDPLSNNASSEEKLARFQEVRQKSDHLIIETCYRNEASKQLLFEAQRINDEIRRNQNSDYYVEPNLIYALPQTTCGAITIQKDTRSETEKQQAELLLDYQKALGEYEEPVQKIIKFQIVGLIPTTSTPNTSKDILEMIESLGNIKLATPLLSRDYYHQHQTEIESIFQTPNNSLDYYGINQQYIIEFADADQARTFIEQESCELHGTINNGCATTDKLFYLSADNNNSLVIDDISHIISTIILIMLLIVLAITILLMLISVLRSISNDSREIAIFRALGFRRTQVMSIYLAYAILIVLIIIGSSILLSFILGLCLNPLLSDWTTSFLQASFFTINNSIKAQIFTPNLFTYTVFSISILLTSSLAAFIPTVFKTRQSIVKGLRKGT